MVQDELVNLATLISVSIIYQTQKRREKCTGAANHIIFYNTFIDSHVRRDREKRA